LLGGSQPADLPFDLSGVEPKFLGRYKCLGIPLLQVIRMSIKAVDSAVLRQTRDSLDILALPLSVRD
jgi:hypothetical protein